MILVSVVVAALGNLMYLGLIFVTKEHSANKKDADVR